MDQIEWKNITLVIFDVDGTLYNQKKLRRNMFFSLLGYYLPRPHKWSDMQILKAFREERERHMGLPVSDLQNEQYTWCRERTGKEISRIRKVVDHWIINYPIRYLDRFVYPGLHELFNTIKKADMQIAVLSDYPAKEKMRAMGLQADLVIHAADKYVNALKPDPAGLHHIAEYFKTDIHSIVLIGDRDDADGEAARQINMPYIIIDKNKIYSNRYFRTLAEQIENR